MAVTELTQATFAEEIGSSELPVLVDFWAEWCQPCKMLSPILDEIADENAEAIRVAKVNIEDHPDIAVRYDVTSLPTLIVFKDGEPDHRSIGAKGKARLLEELADYL